MRKLVFILAVLLLTAPYSEITVLAQTGNGAPSGPHYNLNIIGVTHGKKAPLTGSDRRTIFVPLVSDPNTNEPDTLASASAPILLTPGPFTVCDGNAFDKAVDCNGTTVNKVGAVFQLPCNNLDSLGLVVPCTVNGPGSIASYQVWARVVGKPGGSGTITLCAFDITTNTDICNTDEVLMRNKANKFTDITKTLTTLVNVLGPSGTGNYPLFADGFSGFFWDYDNNGNKVLQLRFYLTPPSN
jgi:hypothetical protein